MSEFKLPNKKVFIKPVLKNGPYSEALAKHGMRAFNDASITLSPDIDTVSKEVATGLTEESQAYLESKLGLKAGDLDPFPTNKYWQEYFIKLGSNPELLNLGVPIDYLKYCVLTASNKVATSEDEIDTHSMFYIEDIQNISEKLSSKADTKVEAIELFNKLTPEGRIKLLKIYGLNTAGNTDKFIKGKLFEELEASPEKFIKIAGKSKERITLEAFIFDLKNNGVLREKAGIYFDKETSLGAKDELVEKFLDPKYQEEYEAYKAKLEHFNK
jgi:hypothetical protein